MYISCIRRQDIEGVLFVSGEKSITCENDGTSSSITTGVSSFGPRNVRS